MHRLTQGGPLTIYAQDWNLMCDMVEQIRKGEENHAMSRSAIRTYVQVYNGTGVIVEEGTVWELGLPLIEPADGVEEFVAHPVFQLGIPTDEDSTLCVLTAPINPHEQGIGVVTGAVAMKCNVSSSSDRWAKPDGNGGMVTGSEGTVRLAYADISTGWCYAILGAGSGGSRYNGYFATSIVDRNGVKEIHVSEGRCFANATPVSVMKHILPYKEEMTILLIYNLDGGVTVGEGEPFTWDREKSCTVIAEVRKGVLRQICHDMPVLWLLGQCEGGGEEGGGENA